MICMYKEYEVKIKIVGSVGGGNSCHPFIRRTLSTNMKFNKLQMG